ncbi:flagellar assembly protein A [Sulfurimonas sp.]|uniref:flagellar assembly protein A n=1 Tax=Sulfurimonas sp. TaxID=2022749 RepID=UPI0035656D4C
MQKAKVKTKNILLSLQKYAKNNDASINIVDFEILDTKTLIKTSKDTDFTEYNEAVQEHYDSEEKMIDYHLEFTQVHTIKLFEKQQKKYYLDYEINYDSMNTHPTITIKINSKIPIKTPRDTYIWLKNEVDTIKARNAILIGLFDESYITKLKLFTKFIHAGKFKKNIKLPLIETIEPNVTQKGQLLLHYEKHKNKHGIAEVDAKEVIAEYRKPKFGRNGLDAFGKVISNTSQKNLKDLDYDTDDETILVKEDNDKKLYISKAKGYVNISRNIMYIDHTIKKRKIKRVEDKVSEHEDNDIKVVVSEKDVTQDSIGEGVELTSETIHVEGFVGSNSVLHATNLTIDGATHQSSHQNAKFAKINRHKGTLRAHQADIKLLEGGTVYATTVNIDACLNGTIYAKDVNITSVKSNLKVYASHSINITLVSGENNTFNIDYKKIPILSKKIEFIDNDIEDLKYHLEEAKRHNQSKIAGYEAEIKKLKDDKNSVINSINDATITVQKAFRGLNNIIFTISDLKELIYKTDNKKYETFHLEIKDEKVTLKPVNISIEL